MPENIINRILRIGAMGAVSAATLHWPSHSRLLLLSDNPAWSIGHDMRELATIASKLGVKIGPSALAPWITEQCLFLGCHFDLLLNDRFFHKGCRLATSYFHGHPGQGVPEFDRSFEMLKKHHREIQRIQVSCSGMESLVLESGINPGSVFLIPIGIDLALFNPATVEQRRAVRAQLGLPETATVIGSFQKDGVGWEEGLEPKLIKGPDVFLRTVARLKEEVKDLVVLLSGPARGYVKEGLTRLGIMYRHVYLESYYDIGRLYHAIDLYMVTSREEGGPKSILESMASGVPLVSTHVGQAVDLVVHGVNGWLVDVEDVDALTYWALHALSVGTDLTALRAAARNTAVANSYPAQLPCWAKFFSGFVE